MPYEIDRKGGYYLINTAFKQLEKLRKKFGIQP